MAGYMTKLRGNVYEGELTNGTSVAVGDGMLMVPGTAAKAGSLVFGAADTTSTFLLKEVTDIYDGMTAYRFVPTALAAAYYLTENNHDIDASGAYDETEYVVAPGELLRAHPLCVGEEFVTDCVTGTLTVGTIYGVKADGTIG